MHALQILVDEEQHTLLNFPGRPKALLDRTVAKLFQVETRYVNRAVARNPERFPDDFCFELNKQEINFLKSHFGISNSREFNRAKPKAFSAEGCNMVAMLLRSDIAVKRSVQIIRAFTMYEKFGKQQESNLPQMISSEIVGERHLIRAVVNEIDFLKQGIHSMQNRLCALENLLGVRCEDTAITEERAQELRAIVKAKAKNRKQMYRIWLEFKQHFELTKYSDLPLRKFDSAVEWLNKYEFSI
ncbi:ORF6N domain-containing protein [Candidatus Uabimicrobium sp. HlEnr_7]|uniref:ORF6N domain-containing protein n=1 Tax=Candidatus Uabimicrobium helgolandensis TaxID=3095367 RepID=UPI003558DDBD